MVKLFDVILNLNRIYKSDYKYVCVEYSRNNNVTITPVSAMNTFFFIIIIIKLPIQCSELIRQI